MPWHGEHGGQDTDRTAGVVEAAAHAATAREAGSETQPREAAAADPRVSSDAFLRARRRRLVARRVACVLALCFVVALFSFGAFNHGASSSGHVRPVLPVESGALPLPPEPPPPDMRRVWAAALARDPSPDLATGGGVGTSGNRVALTFDDGPDPRTTPLILDTLRERGVEATFFVVGDQVAKSPGLLRRIVAEGHTVGNHTYDHADMSDLSAAQMREELRSTQEAVDDVLGSDALPAFRRVAWEQKLFPVMWTVDPADYLLDGKPEGVVRGVAEADEAGRKGEGDEVVLLHDNQRQTAEALPAIIDRYERSGRRVAGVDELLADEYLGP